MRLFALALGLMLAAMPAVAQQAASPAATSTLARSMIKRDIAVLQVLDKVSARTTKLRIPVGSSAAFGLIFINVRSCQIAPPSDLPEAAAFLEISEIDINKLPRSGEVPAGLQPSHLLYSGWMFASSPALAALEHPTYDVTVIACESRDISPAEHAAAGEEGAPLGAAAPAPAAPPVEGENPAEPAPLD